MRRLSSLAMLVLLIGLVWLLLSRAGLIGFGHRTAALTIRQLQLQTKLSVVTVPITSVHTAQLNGYMGGVRLVMEVHGDVEMVIDLEQARLEDVDEAQRCATLVLPDPVASRPRLDHEHTGVFQITRTGLWQVALGGDAEARLVNAAMEEAQHTLEHAAVDTDIAEQARARAARVLQDAAASLGWTLGVR